MSGLEAGLSRGRERTEEVKLGQVEVISLWIPSPAGETPAHC